MPDWCIRFQVFTGILLLFSALSAGNTLAQNKPAATDGSESSQEQPVLDEFSPNPLNSTEPDPLLPNPPASNQVLSSDQQAGLIPALDQLNLEATAALANGNPIQAFTLWTRELRLRRYLGLLPEIEALSRVGLVAWNNGQRLYLKFITERLNEILQQAQPQAEVNLELLQRLGVAFEEVRAKESAVQTYQTLRETYRQQQAILAEERALDQVAAVYLSWLDYSNAAATYESLLELQQEVQSLRGTGALPSLPVPVEGENPQSAETDQPSQVKSLKNLAFIYEQLQQPLQAIAAKEKLVGFYLTQQNPQPIPDLKLSIGQDYEQLGQFQQAGQNYQEAYSLATTIQQFANASEALDRLAKLYRAQNRGETALELYQAQLLINQQSYNLYGMMNSYDNIGQIYFEQKAFQRALAAFQAGLELATQLKYGEDYFLKKIEMVKQQIVPF
ncbi:MAG: tetratricopeptide repeat protein [Oscillatoriales cyanobacterium RM2_1_1]|nr:tetratricopeptide repeat protein [Oscillatoriales cyanobacterium SM2_3_0]NJO46446.1 tetratricopeptide repeat protein [Oscillatoriales cyanobacterium RM2_1_1]